MAAASSYLDDVKTNNGVKHDGDKKHHHDHEHNNRNHSRYKKISQRHSELMKRATKLNIGANASNYKDDESCASLSSFNGYYSVILKNNGNSSHISTFISVDTNITVTVNKLSGVATTMTTVDIVCPSLIDTNNQVTSTASYEFESSNGDTFVNNKLTMSNPSLTLEFTRQNRIISGMVITSTLVGSIKIGDTVYSISGGTENNPIPYDGYNGTYYLTGTNTTSNDHDSSIAVLKISNNPAWNIEYDFGSNDGELIRVQQCAYNLNMYFFSFNQQGSQANGTLNFLIMGTATAQGFCCNNMIAVNYQFKQPRILYTIPKTSVVIEDGSQNANAKHAESLPNHYREISRHHRKMKHKYEEDEFANHPNSSQLAPFSGYYQLNVSPGSFVSIQANIYYLNGRPRDYTVKIGISLNGSNSYEFTFNTNCSFDGKTLIIPGFLNVDLVREYKVRNSFYGSLVSLNGIVLGKENINGYSYLNPVSLSGFNGIYYRPLAAKNPVLTVSDGLNGKTQISFSKTPLNSFTYVPLMYMLYPSRAPTMSFGTTGKHGVTCIFFQTIDGKSKPPYIGWAYNDL